MDKEKKPQVIVTKNDNGSSEIDITGEWSPMELVAIVNEGIRLFLLNTNPEITEERMRAYAYVAYDAVWKRNRYES